MAIILASASPRRQELLGLITPNFTVEPSNAEEILPQGLNPAQTVEHLAIIKAQSVYEKNSGATVIGSDTIVVLNDKILGKPQNIDDAKRMLTLLSGNEHKVFTGVCIINNDICQSFIEEATVVFNQMTDEEIDWYANSGEPDDKAGAYGIQGFGARYVKGITGDYYTVMGLPVSRVYKALVKLNVI